MGEQVEVLENHADLGSALAHLAIAQFVEPAPAFPITHHLAVHGQAAAVHLLQMVYAAQESGLARARRPDYAQDLALAHLEVDAAQDLQAAEVLSHTFGPDHHLGGGHVRRGFTRSGHVSHRRP